MAVAKGFFLPEQLHSVGLNGPSSGECEECLLYKNCKNPRMGVTGEGKKGILIVGQMPGATEDRTGAPMSGESGIFLKEKLKKLGIDFDRDCYKINAVACYPGKDAKDKTKEVTRKHIKCCKPRLMKVINDLKPRHIWLLGDDAVASYFMERESNCSITRWRAFCIPDPDHKAWIVPLYHPAYILRNEKDDNLLATFDRDLKFAVKCSQFDAVPEHVTMGKCVTILKTYDDVVRELEKLIKLNPERVAYDYETTGLKPYRKGHKIASMSFCYSYDRAYSFPYEYRKHFTPEQLNHIGDLWVEFLLNRSKKIMANSKFEDMWSREIMGVEPNNIWWCTMNAAHIIDTRSDITGLKFQSLIRWGIPDYDSHMDKFKKGTKSSPYNKIMDAPLNDLLLYGGIDSLLTFRLQEEQEEDLRPFKGLQRAREFFMEGLSTLCDLQENGISMNRQYYVDQDEKLGIRIKEMEDSLYKFPEALKFEKVKKRRLNFGSPQDLAELFFKILELPKGKQTDGGNDCTDAGVLAELNTPIAKELTKIAKLKKIKGTYLGQFLREIEDDEKIHPFFDLHVPRTLRGSSSNPNFQNIPVRDEEAKNITRSGIIPSILQEFLGQSFKMPDGSIEEYIGNKMMDFDYGAMEVRIIACYTQDPTLMAYIFDDTTDMHRDMAIDIFKFGKTWDTIPSKLGKKIRFEAKNGATFPWFYNSYYRSIARNLFAKCMSMICYEGITILEHLKSIGVIKSNNTTKAYEEFEAHIKKVEDRFWHKFHEVKKWQEAMMKSYLKLGYIEQKFGFRCGGYLSHNDVVNYPIQGTAFHCLVWSLNEIVKEIKRQRLYTRVIGQIHDCCLDDLFPPERKIIMDLSSEIATVRIREVHPWINVPLMIEWEEGEVNQSWADKIECRED